MNDIEIASYKKRLEEELTQLTEQLTAVGGQLKDGDWIATPNQMDYETPEFDETADRIEEYQENVAILSELEPRYVQVKKALQRIEAGTYGTCEKSGGPIEKARLDADPAATTNIANKDA